MAQEVPHSLRLIITAFLICAMALLVCYTTPAAASRPTNRQAGEWLRDTESRSNPPERRSWRRLFIAVEPASGSEPFRVIKDRLRSNAVVLNL